MKVLVGSLMLAGLVGYNPPATAEETTAETTNMDEVVCSDNAVLLNLEEPRNGVPSSGVSNLRGWAISPEGIDRIELWVDGKYLYDLPHGGLRGDIYNAHPDYPNARESGFSMAYNYSLRTAGEHTFMVRAVTPSGTCKERSEVTEVVRFENSYYAGDDAMDLSEAGVSIEDNKLIIAGARTGDTANDIVLGWHERTQKLGVDGIISYGLDDLYRIDGYWRADYVYNGDVELDGDTAVCTEGGEIPTVTHQVTHEGSIVTIDSTSFEYQGNHPVFGMMFKGRQEENDLYGGVRITDWELRLDSNMVSGTGTWVWSNGESECSGTTEVTGSKIFRR